MPRSSPISEAGLARRKGLGSIKNSSRKHPARGPKDKGKTFEREVVAQLLAAFPQLTDKDIVARSMGDPGQDILLSTRASELIPLAMELKRAEKFSLDAALRQANAHAAKSGLTPCVVFRKSRQPAYAVIPLSLLVGLLQKVSK